MMISIIIPTHNRADQLRQAIESILPLRGEAEFEIVVVDNNSVDDTRALAQSYPELVRYVFEGRTSFTRARTTGGEEARGDVLLYLDDDVIVTPGSLEKIAEVFARYPDAGVIAGKILPQFTETPPPWTLECQRAFNGWSLYDPENISNLSDGFQEVEWAAGPMMAIRRSIYEQVGGFPPDTVGVETNRGEKLFNKLYIGPGDSGLCDKIRGAGFKVYYSPEISVYHVIPPIRFTVSFWRSRMIGEGYYQAISQREFFHLNVLSALLKRYRHVLLFYQFQERLLARLATDRSSREAGAAAGVFPEELWVRFHKAYLDMDLVLRKYPWLGQFLWRIGYEGVNDANFDQVMRILPEEYKNLVSNDYVYDSSPLDSEAAYQALISNKGYYPFRNALLEKASCRSLINGLWKLWSQTRNWTRLKGLSPGDGKINS